MVNAISPQGANAARRVEFAPTLKAFQARAFLTRFAADAPWGFAG